mgnify:CR=1 FL=1
MEKLTLDDMIKALKCVASQDTVGDCYADHENFIHMDDEHKRIVCGTGEDLRDYISGKEAIGCPYHQNTYGCCFEDGELYWLKDVAELLEELKSYKDLEEQGLLVRLPCKVGDTVYVPTRNFISELRITLISVDTSDGAMYFSWMLNDGIYPNLDGFSGYELGKTVFLTREEAEKKLEEMKNGKK